MVLQVFFCPQMLRQPRDRLAVSRSIVGCLNGKAVVFKGWLSGRQTIIIAPAVAGERGKRTGSIEARCAATPPQPDLRQNR
jgi:hypothetical protein